MKTLLLLCILSTSLFFSCKNDSSANQQKNQPDPAVHVRLDNGQKWIANKETTEGINNMMVLVNALPAQPSVDDYHSLKSKLDEEFDAIIRKCTMEGEAHNQLHEYLMPLREIIERLGSNSTEKLKVASDDLGQYLKDYNKYFV